MREHPVLDTSPQYPATQQKGVDREHIRVFLCNQESDEPIVSKAVSNFNTQADQPILRQFANFTCRTTQSREIELIRPFCQLRKPRPILRRGWADLNLKI